MKPRMLAIIQEYVPDIYIYRVALYELEFSELDGFKWIYLQLVEKVYDTYLDCFNAIADHIKKYDAVQAIQYIAWGIPHSVIALETELQLVSGLDASAPSYAIKDRVREILEE